MEESNNCFKMAFDYSTTGLAFVTLDGYLNKVNPAFCKMLGYNQE